MQISPHEDGSPREPRGVRALKRPMAVLCAVLAAAPMLPAQEQAGTGITISGPPSGGLRGLITPYRGRTVAPVDLTDSSRLDSLMRAGNIYLSLQDAIALALENNLDIAVQRYGGLIAQQDVLRAESGGLLRGVTQSVQAGPSGGGQGVSSGVLGSAATSGGGSSSANVNGVITQLGPTTPNLDPVLQGFVNLSHTTSPQTSTFLTGTTSLINQQKSANFSVTQGFLTGGQGVLSFSNSFLNQNSFQNQINPSAATSLDLTISQHLLQGFGFAVNNRNIRIARNELPISDIVFKEQVISTVSSIISLYWQLVSFNENVAFAKQNLALSQKTYEDNKKQVEIGTLAPIEIVRAEAEVAAREQDLTVAQTNVLQQETIIKNALSKHGVANPAVAEARIVPTDRIHVPEKEDIPALKDLLSFALNNRPELPQTRYNLENSRIGLVGQKSGLLPTVDVYGELTNHGQSGEVNPLNSSGQPDAFFVGGYGTALGQVFRRNFPDYQYGVQANVILRNRAAQADYVYNQLQLRQSELGQQKQINQVGVDVRNALIGVEQARAQYQAAVKQRVLQEQTLDAEQKKYALGASTVFLVIQAQRDLAQAQSNEVTAESNYQQARLNLEVATGNLLNAYHVNIDEAKAGRVKAPPSPVPVVDPNGKK